MNLIVSNAKSERIPCWCTQDYKRNSGIEDIGYTKRIPWSRFSFILSRQPQLDKKKESHRGHSRGNLCSLWRWLSVNCIAEMEMCLASRQMEHASRKLGRTGKCVVRQSRWIILQGDWVVRGNVSYLEAGGSYFKGNGEACNTSLRREGQPIQLKKQIRWPSPFFNIRKTKTKTSFDRTGKDLLSSLLVRLLVVLDKPCNPKTLLI